MATTALSVHTVHIPRLSSTLWRKSGGLLYKQPPEKETGTSPLLTHWTCVFSNKLLFVMRYSQLFSASITECICMKQENRQNRRLRDICLIDSLRNDIAWSFSVMLTVILKYRQSWCWNHISAAATVRNLQYHLKQFITTHYDSFSFVEFLKLSPSRSFKELLLWSPTFHQLCLGCASRHHPTWHYNSSLQWPP